MNLFGYIYMLAIASALVGFSFSSLIYRLLNGKSGVIEYILGGGIFIVSSLAVVNAMYSITSVISSIP